MQWSGQSAKGFASHQDKCICVQHQQGRPGVRESNARMR